MIQHMVLLKFREDVDEEQIKRVFAEIADLKNKISGILYYGGGPYSSPEGFNKQFTHGFLVTFDSAASRNAYLPHPDHEAVKDKLLAMIDDAVAFDFEAEAT